MAKTVVTHDNGFHADDVFAVATLKMVFEDINVIRTRDEEAIKNADVVVDVGRIYAPLNLRFDHHQEGAAGKRENGVPYASFGLVWKEFGEKVTGSLELASIIDKSLVAPIDADDNGFSINIPKFDEVGSYSVSSVIGSLNPTFLEKDKTSDEIFPKAVELAGQIIEREIASAKTVLEARRIFSKAYENSSDKRIVVLETEIGKHSWQSFVREIGDTLLYVVHPYGDKWAIRAVRKNRSSFENRKDLPIAWAGKLGLELEKITGVSGAVFCHNGRFIATAKTKEAALALLDLALAS